MSTLPRRRATTLSDRIRADIEKRILDGRWPPGHRIPFEHELVARYKCSRMTVNKAITSLVTAGLVVRRRRAGSFVAEPMVSSAVLEIPDIRADVLACGRAYSMRLLSCRRRRPAARNAQENLLAAQGELLELRCLHFADATPYALEERLISLLAVPEAARTDFSAQPPGSWLLGHVPWTEAEHRIRAVNAGESAATLLEIGPGTACLEMERRTWRGPDHITHVRQLFPGTLFDLTARFTPKAK